MTNKSNQPYFIKKEVIMKTLAIIIHTLKKKNLTFYRNYSVIILLALILSGIWMPGLISTCSAQGPWTKKTNMPTARFGHSSSVLDGKIYVIGGSKSLYGQALKTLEVYDPILDAWTSKADMAEGRTAFSTCVVNGNIYAIGGSQTFYSGPRTSIEEYNPITNTWTHKTDMPTVRYCHSSCVLDGKIYVIGGSRVNSGEADATLQVYDPILDTWTSKADMNTPRIIFSACVVNGKIYAIGGSLGPASNYSGMNTVEEYDPATDTWTKKANMITRRKYISACSLNGKIYVFGGEEDLYTLPLSSGEVYDPVTDTWKEITNMPSVLEEPSADMLNGKAYVCGGTLTASPATPVSTMYEYNPHNDLLLLIEKVYVDRCYLKPGIDSVCIITKINYPAGITLIAEIEAPDQNPVDSLLLYDDGNHNDGNAGDSLYGNFWPVSYAEERNYYVDIKVKRVGADTAILHINNTAKFTTIGPVDYESYTFTGNDTEPNPGDRIRLELTLKNNGSILTAANIEAKLISLDTLVSTYAYSRAFGSIAAGKNSTSDNTYTINISEECPVNTQIPIQIDITSDGYKFWTDTLYVHVCGPTRIEYLEEQITRIYPNPTNDILNIEFSNRDNQVLEIEILDITGKIIYQKEYKNNNAHFVEQLNLSDYKNGVYLVKVRQADRIYVRKVVVK
jgi:N-acetylneuraminic acid mutarotase